MGPWLALAQWVLLDSARVRSSQLSCMLESREDFVRDSDAQTSLSEIVISLF